MHQYKLTFLIFLAVGVYTAKACKCQNSENVQEEFEQTSFIVSGKVLSKSHVSYESILSEEELDLIRKKFETNPQKMNGLKLESIIKIELAINHIYKGTGIKDKITIYTSKFGQSCGYLGFEIGQNFIAYLSSTSYLNTFYNLPSKKLDETKENGVFWTNHCRRTRVFDKTEDKELRKLMNG